MSFKEWCLQVFGIYGFSEGKIANSIFIPALSNTNFVIDPALQKAGAFLINNPFMTGIVFPVDKFNEFKKELIDFYNNSKGKPEFYLTWLQSYFNTLGLDLNRESEYKEPSPINIIFNNEEKRIQFLFQFISFNPVSKFSFITGMPALELSPLIITYLKQLYTKSSEADINNSALIPLMQSHIVGLENLKANIERHNLRLRLDYAHILSRDMSNVFKNGVNLQTDKAASAYSISLKVYAEVNKDNLTDDQYRRLNYASSLLAAYDEQGHLKQSLMTDTKFCKFLLKNQRLGQNPLIMDREPSVRDEILHSIDENIVNMLHGNSLTKIGNDSYFRMFRFLPDAHMNSATNEIILQGGGASTHFSIYRIIKIGILANGAKASITEKPLYFEYYKIEDDLGRGTHGIDFESKTCLGTYVTKLEPNVYNQGVIVPLNINPLTHPREYQVAMEFTIGELIRVERHLMFYREPIPNLNVASVAPEGSREAIEWKRLNDIKIALSGKPCSSTIEYYTRDPLDARKWFQRAVSNQRKYFQEGASCTIFSLKCMVGTAIGPDLTTRHINFMQLNNGEGHLATINEKIDFLKNRIAYSMASKAVEDQLKFRNRATFFGGTDFCVNTLKQSLLNNAHLIQKVQISRDLINSEKSVIKMGCSSAKGADILAKSVELHVGCLTGFAVIGKDLVIDNQSFRLLCEKLNLPYDALIVSFDEEPKPQENATRL